MQKSQNGCKRNNRRAGEGKQLTVARVTNQQEKEEDTGLRPAGRENKETKREKRQQLKTNIASKTASKWHYCRVRDSPFDLDEYTQRKTLPLTVLFRANP